MWSTVALTKSEDYDSHRGGAGSIKKEGLKSKNVIRGVGQTLLHSRICHLVAVTSHL